MRFQASNILGKKSVCNYMNEPLIMAEFQAKTEQHSFEFLKADLELCFTFADIVETELGIQDAPGAQQALAKAEDGYAAISRLLVHLRGLRRSEIRRGLQQLHTRLETLKSRLEERPAALRAN